MNDDPARARFFVIQAMRWSGLAMVVAGLAIILGKLDLPREAGHALFLIGLADALIVPSVLARAWKDAAAMKRFYKTVSAEPVEVGWRVLLDGRAVRTAGRREQIVPTPALAEAMAAEWASQGDDLDLSRFVLRDLADYAIDVVAPGRDAVIGEILPYGETDTLCYRGEEGEPLQARQLEVWEPLLTAAETRWDVHFERVGGIIHRPQPPATLARMASVLAAESDWSLAALRTLSSLAASLVVALAAIAPGADAAALWDAACLEEDWQAELWGKDAEAAALRERRFAAFTAAIGFAALAWEEPARR